MNDYKILYIIICLLIAVMAFAVSISKGWL